MEENQRIKSGIFDSQFLHQLERLAILSRQVVSGQLQGERRSPKRGQSVEFSDFRPYTIGDDFRKIDWNAFARLEKLFIKLFVEEEDITIHFLIDSSTSMDWGNPNKFEYSIQAVAALGYIALTGLDRASAYTTGSSNKIQKYFPPQRGKKQVYNLFNFLENITPTNRINFLQEMIRFRSIAKQAGPLILLTDLYDPDWKEALSTLAKGKYEITLLHIFSPEELDPRFNGDLKLIDSETNQEIEITADFDLIQKYKNNLIQWKSEVEYFCNQRNIIYIPIDTTISLKDLLFSKLRHQGVLK